MPTHSWTTASYRRGDRFRAWQYAINRSHLEWALTRPRSADVAATLRQRTLAGVEVVECRCGPCAGQRGPAQIAGSRQAYFGLLFVLSGRDIVHDRGNRLQVEAGDLLLWDSTRPMRFEVPEPLHKLTLLIPQPRLRALLPRAEEYAGLRLRGSSGVGALASGYLRTLAAQLADLEEESGGAAMEMTLQLLATAFESSRRAWQPAARDTLLPRICEFIEHRLGDEQLSPAAIAAAHNISLRYLHLLFAGHSLSVARWIRHRRLLRCRRELGGGQRQASVTEIALRWGFSDAGNFSRAFKQEFGVAPRAFRQSCVPPAPGVETGARLLR